MEPDISAKQSYLYQNIIQGGYSPQIFQEYLLSKNPTAGVDLNAWKMVDLEAVTQKFKQEQSTSKQVQAVTEPISATSISSAQSSPTKTLRNQSLIYTAKHQNANKSIECVKIKPTNFVLESHQITLQGFQKKQGGMFEKSYVVYKVKLSTINYLVQRRYSDFQWLRETLVILHPGLPIPPLSKKGKMRRHEQKHLYKRMYLLEKFLKRLDQIPDCRADKVFESFFTLQSKQFQREKQKYKKIKSLPYEKVQNTEGSLAFILSQNVNTFNNRCQKYFTVAQPQVKKIYKQFKGAATMLEGCSVNLKNVSTTCKNLSVIYRQFRKQSALPVNTQNMFTILESTTNKYADILNDQAKTFRKQIYALVKYESYFMMNMIESLDNLSKLQQNFFDQKLNLAKRKERLYQEGNMSKWGLTQKITNKPQKQQAFELMLPKDTAEVLKIRDSYALANYQLYQQGMRHFRAVQKYYSKQLENFMKLQSGFSTQMIKVWADGMINNKILQT